MPPKSFNTLTDSADYRLMGHATLAVDFISTIDNRFEKEKKILGRTVKTLLMETGTISNKAIIISLVKQLELSHDIDKSLLLRSALEIIVGITPDDIF
ncbi:biofilm development regulator YmgB/AriR family protein [Rosenbergiella metrosideri]|uniref:biofilm development regulator YmgB/AriR family protein n=1 Tax=Rosenbergiella metrosideri TaxID=2921185 RepID=UPI001F4FCDB2|nr:biofilm development regulator YmgB/AriR family protein [Rosenbergiella metrosideri]